MTIKHDNFEVYIDKVIEFNDGDDIKATLDTLTYLRDDLKKQLFHLEYRIASLTKKINEVE